MSFKPAKGIFEVYPDDWPPKEYYVDPHEVTRDQLNLLQELIHLSVPETELDKFLRNNLSVFACCLAFASIGHHGTWIIPQQQIRPPQTPVLPGLKPDYIIGGKNSDGFFWYVVELKGANENIFSGIDSQPYFSKAANKGISQLLGYIDYCSEAQSYLRDTLRLTGFREPRGLMLIGKEDEFQENPNLRRLKAAWNRVTRGELEIRTYSGLIREIEEKITSMKKIQQITTQQLGK